MVIQRSVLIDVGEHANQKCLDTIKSTLASEKCSIDTILLTHWHPDHVGGLNDVLKICPEATVYKSPLIDNNTHDLVKKFRPKLNELSIQPRDINYPYKKIVDGQVFTTEDGKCELEAIFTPGHAMDHMCFYFKEENSLFTGDNILGGSTTIVEDLLEYMKSLEKMKQKQANMLYTAHGNLEKSDAIDRYIQHRTKRETQILEKMMEEIGKQITPFDLVEMIYIPEGLKEQLRLPAAGNVLSHLVKLCVEGKVNQGDTSDVHFIYQ